MSVASRRQPGIASPSVGMNCRPGRHRTLNEGKKAVCGDILDAPKADAAGATAILLGCDRDDGLVIGFSPSRALFRAADISFINLDSPGQKVPSGPDHRPAQLVQPRPGGLVAAKPQHPLQTTSPGTTAA